MWLFQGWHEVEGAAIVWEERNCLERLAEWQAYLGRLMAILRHTPLDISILTASHLFEAPLPKSQDEEVLQVCS